MLEGRELVMTECVIGVWLGYVVFFFFFKQKTAYEIVDCDWSSDVCSSDLSSAAIYLQLKSNDRLRYSSVA